MGRFGCPQCSLWGDKKILRGRASLLKRDVKRATVKRLVKSQEEVKRLHRRRSIKNSEFEGLRWDGQLGWTGMDDKW